jgi:hypothetical protein
MRELQVCPVCDSAINSSKLYKGVSSSKAEETVSLKQCLQCGSNLEIYNVIETLNDKMKQASGNDQSINRYGGLKKKNFVAVLVFIVFLFIIGLMIQFYNFQESLLAEIKLQSDERVKIEAQRAMATEEWFQKSDAKISSGISEALNSMGTLEKAVSEQQETLKRLKEKIEFLERVELQRSIKKTTSIKRRRST